MFYINFIIVILTILITFYVSYWLFIILKLKHKGEGYYGKLLNLYNIRTELVKTYFKTITLEGIEKEKALKVMMLLDKARKEYQLNRRLNIEHEISNLLENFVDESKKEEEDPLKRVTGEIHYVVDRYNEIVSTMETFLEKKTTRLLASIFGIKSLKRIEVYEKNNE